MTTRLLSACLLVLFSLASPHTSDAAPPKPTRVADVIGGHVHPSLCRAENGDLLAVYNISGGGGKELLLCRSIDGGETWSEPVAIPTIKECSIYPGSLKTLSDGRIVLQWSCYRDDEKGRWREPQYCISEDNGQTWSQPRSLPIDDHTNYSCLRHPILELSPDRWVCPLYDRTIIYDAATHSVEPFSDGRNHGMVPIVKTARGTIISGAPQAHAPVPVGKPGETVRGLRSADGGKTWQALHAFPYFGVAGYDLNVLDNGLVLMTYIVYGVGRDKEWSYEIMVSRDDGKTWDREHQVEVYNPGREIGGRGWPRTVQIDEKTIGTLFYDLNAAQSGGPGLFFVRTPIAAFAAKSP